MEGRKLYTFGMHAQAARTAKPRAFRDKLHVRHGADMSAPTRERITRPVHATPRRAADWN